MKLLRILFNLFKGHREWERGASKERKIVPNAENPFVKGNIRKQL